MNARPCLKWAGGKRLSVQSIVQVLPSKIGTYREPFFGGGAVFFELAHQGRFERAVLSDSNPELIEFYQQLRDHTAEVFTELKALKPERMTAKKYYRIRASKPRKPARRAARTLVLNKCGFNGLYRVNRAGEFNVPWNKAKSYQPDYENLIAVAEVLQRPNVSLECCDFAEPFKQLEVPGSLPNAGYFDPPYLPESKTARFAGYTPNGFDFRQQKRLAALYGELAAGGMCVVASNASIRAAVRLYEDIPGTLFYDLHCPRAINSKGGKRGRVGELLIVNPGNLPGESRTEDGQ